MRAVRTELLVLLGVHGGAGFTGLAPAYTHSVQGIHCAAAGRLGHQGTGRVQTLTFPDTGETQASPRIWMSMMED